MLTEFSQVESLRQVVTFLLALALGASLCLLHDGVRCFHVLWPPGRARAAVSDVLGFSLAAVATALFFMVRCSGQARLFALLGEGIGFVAWRWLISRRVMPPVVRLLKHVRAACRQIGSRLRAALARLGRKMAEIYRKTHKNSQKRLAKRRSPDV